MFHCPLIIIITIIICHFSHTVSSDISLDHSISWLAMDRSQQAQAEVRRWWLGAWGMCDAWIAVKEYHINFLNIIPNWSAVWIATISYFPRILNAAGGHPMHMCAFCIHCGLPYVILENFSTLSTFGDKIWVRTNVRKSLREVTQCHWVRVVLPPFVWSTPSPFDSPSLSSSPSFLQSKISLP